MKERRYLGALATDKRIILKFLLKAWDMKILKEFNLTWIGSIFELL
jgi:hypothetical protein